MTAVLSILPATLVTWKVIGGLEWDGPHGRAYLEDLLNTLHP